MAEAVILNDVDPVQALADARSAMKYTVTKVKSNESPEVNEATRKNRVMLTRRLSAFLEESLYHEAA